MSTIKADTVTAATSNTNLNLTGDGTGTVNLPTGFKVNNVVGVPVADGGTGASDAATAFTNIKQAASTTATGVVEQSTSAENATGTADDKFPSVLGTKEIASNILQQSKSVAYTTVLTDAGKHIYHPSADTTARIWTIDSNANVAYPIGTMITFANDTSGGVITIAITSDTLVLVPDGTTGSRSLAANGLATALKVTATRWMISGSGLT